MAPNKETRQFDADVGKVLHLMINAIYTNKDIFLRELISNASDAIDKLRYQSQTDDSLLKEGSDFLITVKLDKTAKTITVSDNGIGMNRQDLIDNLGRIASSGTQKFIETLGNSKADLQLIGQFGVGFYSAFMVASEVKVVTKKAGEEQAWAWHSKGDSEFSIEESAEDTPRGTSIVLHLKEEAESYLDRFQLRNIIKTYSDHISVPVKLQVEGDKEEAETVNSSSALWARNKSEITEEQYNEFYKTVAFAGDKPWLTLHNKNEGNLVFTNLLFVPSKKPFDLFHPDRKARVKLYVKKVFITDENVNLVPPYLRFLRGIVDSEDLPLNISRETLQHNLVIEKIRKAIVKKLLSELNKKQKEAREEYVEFWQNFGAVLKEGLCEMMVDKEKESLLEACMFHNNQDDKLITLDEYVSTLPEKQKHIYYLTGDDLVKMKTSPQLEGFNKHNIKVLLLTDPVDDFWVNVVNDYKGFELKSVTRSDIDFGELSGNEENKQAVKKEAENTKSTADTQSLVDYFKEQLTGLVKEVKITNRLTDSPACLTVAEGAMDIRMERFLLEQKQLPALSLKNLEINPEHPLVRFVDEYKNNSHEQAMAADLVKLIFDQACILEGEPVKDLASFARRMNMFLERTCQLESIAS